MKFKVAGIQMGPYPGDYESNMEKALEVLEGVVKKVDPYVVLFSEVMTGPYFCQLVDDKFFKLAEPVDGRSVTTLTKKAKELGVHIVGTFFEKAVEHGQTHYYNSAYLCSPTRGLVGVYRKVHLPKVNQPSLTCDEKYYFERLGGGGKDFPVYGMDNGVKVGMLLCFDRSFPESWRELMLKSAQVVFLLVATWGFREAIFVQELQIRAIENRIFVVAVNKAGDEIVPGEAQARNHFGKSSIIDPNVEIVAQTGKEPWGYVAAEIDLDKIEEAKKVIDWKAERKPHLYKTISV